MKNVVHAIAFAAAAFAMTAASADPQVTSKVDGTVQIKAPAKYQLKNNEFDAYETTYMLEDGNRLKFTHHASHYYAKLEGEKRVEMVPQAPGVFMTVSGAYIEFRDDGETVGVGNYAKLAVNSKVPADTMMLAKR
ncbi:hypothetical protein GCM10027277_16340 [Pseudoduganella ginsengisoli]|uniref:Gel scht n=1 Tax=Pseudoduganella ginsengisoli TaxID=1462440 RepID=A0A6L6PVG8_9BURK|nr:hypothetical protein [Pseudoduganella ginsengisoli]MTW01104.1 hypothetical protein [Pseudoduganella ginsengisoli]